jgi:hypothetical protein
MAKVHSTSIQVYSRQKNKIYYIYYNITNPPILEDFLLFEKYRTYLYLQLFI